MVCSKSSDSRIERAPEITGMRSKASENYRSWNHSGSGKRFFSNMRVGERDRSVWLFYKGRLFRSAH
jgi:hypothetical protein